MAVQRVLCGGCSAFSSYVFPVPRGIYRDSKISKHQRGAKSVSTSMQSCLHDLSDAKHQIGNRE